MKSKSITNSLQVGSEIELQITDINYRGQGVGRFEGRVIFVALTLPAEYVLVTITRVKKNYAIGEIKTIILASNNRVKAPCPVFGSCGGCAVMHINYQEQLHWKQKVVQTQLEREFTSDSTIPVYPTIGMKEPWFYRSKTQMPFGGSNKKTLAGFYARGSHEIVDTEQCLIQHPIADLIRATVRDFINEFNLTIYDELSHQGLFRHLVVRVGLFTGQVMVVLVINGKKFPFLNQLKERLLTEISAWHAPTPSSEPLNFQLTSMFLNFNEAKTNLVQGAKFKLVFGRDYIEEKICDLTYKISAQSFFQVNPRQTEILYAKVLEYAGLKGHEQVLDLYCGTGSITLLLAQKAQHVYGVELVAEAIQDAKYNADKNNICNVTFVTAAAEEWLSQFCKEKQTSVDLAVVDPPRKGCADELLTALQKASIGKILYISCNPAALATDLHKLSRSYRVAFVQPIDMFAHSDSIECIALLEAYL